MASKVKVNEQQFADRWERGLQGASQRIQEGVNAVTEAPGKKAAAQKQLWLTNVQNSADKWEQNVQVPLEDWRSAMIQKGIPALQNSIALAKPKVQSNAGRIINVLNNALSNMPPRGATLDQNLDRVRHIATAMKKGFVR